MNTFSVVISLKNAAATIEEPIKSCLSITDDIIIYDNGSTDDTETIVKKYPVRFISGEWKGFGPTKNDADSFAKHDWILSLDADESPDEELKASLKELDLSKDDHVYEFNFKTFLGNKWVRFGEWGIDRHIRLFNRKKVRWNNALVHESLELPADVVIKRVKGYILHRTVSNVAQYEQKMKRYAKMNAEKYFHDGKRPSAFKKYLSPVFSFMRNYIFRLGFLDGSVGLTCARMTASYTYLKYKHLEEMYRKD